MLPELVETIVAFAKVRHGWTQTELAERAGLAPAVVSRAKKSCNFSTVEALARAAGMKITAMPDDGYVGAVLTGIDFSKGS
jgi:transcriptional regulator with XRE-family HTH domain